MNAGGIALVVGAYLLGSIPSSYLLVRNREGVDIREHGSGNAGATNVLRVSGPGLAVLTLLLDIAKGAAPVVLGKMLEMPGPAIGMAGVAAVLGHVFPVYLGFRGGKGVATAAGVMLVLDPLAAVAGIVVFVILVLVTRYVALGSMGSVAAFPVLAYLLGLAGWTEPPAVWFLLNAAFIALLIIVRHQSNIVRIRAGTELKTTDIHQREEIR